MRRLATIHVGPQPEGIAALGPDLWVVSRQSGDPASRRVMRRIAYNAADAVAETGSVLRVTSDG